MSEDQLLKLDIAVYNQAMDIQWQKDKIEKNLSGELLTCSCGRKYSFSCICPEGKKSWNDMIQEVSEVSKQNNNFHDMSAIDPATKLLAIQTLREKFKPPFRYGVINQEIYDRNDNCLLGLQQMTILNSILTDSPQRREAIGELLCSMLNEVVSGE